jgi:hypothetical protein
MRLNGKIAVVGGGGQQPGETTGNGRATPRPHRHSHGHRAACQRAQPLPRAGPY